MGKPMKGKRIACSLLKSEMGVGEGNDGGRVMFLFLP